MITRQPILHSSLCAALALALSPVACGSGDSRGQAIAQLEPIGASGIGGTVSFKTGPGGDVHVEARVTGLSPGDHGFHIHEFGDCSAADGSSAGEHFNPDGHRHGSPDAPPHHAGDLGNLVTPASVELTSLDATMRGFTVDTGPRGILGRSVVIHTAPDDLTSQPAGNSGARVACGVIRAVSGGTTPVVAPH